MTYRFLGHTMKLAIYRCPVCNLLFRAQAGSTHVTCATVHLPGSCCHYGEREVSPEQLQSVMSALDEEKSYYKCANCDKLLPKEDPDVK